MQHKALAPRQLAHSPFTSVKVVAKIQLESQTLPHLHVARMRVNLRLPLIPLVLRYIPVPSHPFQYILYPGTVHHGTVRTEQYGAGRSGIQVYRTYRGDSSIVL